MPSPLPSPMPVPRWITPRRPAVLAAVVAALAITLALAAPANAAADQPGPAGSPPRADAGGGYGPQRFDLQAHRGGIGFVVESTLAAFRNALDIGVSTLELDVQITQDRRAVVTHDRQVAADIRRDTGPAYPNDPEYPYVGDYVKNLTLAQIRTLDCGSQTLPDYPHQRPAPGARMPLLAEVFHLVNTRHANRVNFNIETKVEAGAPEETAPREQFVQIVAREVRQAHLIHRVSIQSFDWAALMRMQQVEPRLPVVALTNIDFLECGQPGASPWLGGIDADDYNCDLVAAANSFDADAISPVHGDPQNGTVTDPGYRPYVTPTMVDAAHAAGMEIIPWTVNDKPTMHALMNAGVDGLITDYPNRLRAVMADRGLKLPKRYPAPSDTQEDTDSTPAQR